MATVLSSPTAWPKDQPRRGGLLIADATEFRQKYNKTPFLFHHDLAHSSIFSLARLATVAEKMLDRGDHKRVVLRGAKSTFEGAKFSDMPLKQQLSETIRQMANENVWLKLTSAELVDPEYTEIMHRVLREVEELSGQPVLEHVTWSSLTVFVASPRVVTPYHIDHESNFLLQVQGSKDISLFDPSDRELVPSNQLENFYAGDFEAAKYRPDLQSRGTVFPLTPGAVVHHPPLAPHWVQNGSEVSVSLSIGYCLRPLDRRARIYQVNHFLRKAGLKPTPPGKSPLRDKLKIAGVGLISKSNPKTPQDILFSGLTRVTAPPRAVKRWIKSLRQPKK